jgi:AcrR family transcriptional regulator
MTDGVKRRRYESPRRRESAERTREAIIGAARTLFLERGYEQTTMRVIAQRADVALGNAYYYFHSKEHLIQAFYGRTHEEHLAASEAVLATERDLKARLLGVLRTKVETIEPYHQFAGKLFKTAADPQSPLNPFSEESQAVRQESIAVFAEVVTGSNTRVPKDLMADLPYMLWLCHMGIILFWIHDSSPRRERTYRLLGLAVDIMVKLIGVGSNPLMRPLRKSAVRLMAELGQEASA